MGQVEPCLRELGDILGSAREQSLGAAATAGTPWIMPVV